MSIFSRNILFLFLAILIVLSNGWVGHYYAPWGLNLTPVVIGLTSAIAIWGVAKVSIIAKSVLAYFFIALNDILIRLYSGGTHDQLGEALIVMFMILGVIITLLFFVTNVFIKNKEKKKNKTIAVVLFLVLVVIHWSLFSGFGLEY